MTGSNTRGWQGAARLRYIAFGVAGAVAFAFAPLPQNAHAEQDALSGTWSGGGYANFSGKRERAKCRVTYREQSASVYAASGTCAIESGRADQTAMLRKVGANSYAGSFTNSEYGISGRISVSVNGNRQMLTLTSEQGSAQLSLSR